MLLYTKVKSKPHTSLNNKKKKISKKKQKKHNFNPLKLISKAQQNVFLRFVEHVRWYN